MPRRKPAQRLTQQMAELAFAAPQVVAHRMARMAMAGPVPNARDQREFSGMGREKLAAFNESWAAMALQSARVQQTLWLAPWQALAAGRSAHPVAMATRQMQQLQNAGLSVLNQGMAPVRKRAVGNAKRLGGWGLDAFGAGLTKKRR